MVSKKNEVILFIDYVDTTITSSGSSVRPLKMLLALKKAGYEVLELTGNQVARDRKEKVKKMISLIRKTNVKFCYIESPTYPIMKSIDRRLIKIIHSLNIPIGYFYRDFYRMFPDEFPRRTSLIGRLKDVYLDILQYLTDCSLRYCDIVYVPSEECKVLLKYKDIRPLPPAGENRLVKRKIPNHTVIYVGGISEHYGGSFLLDVFNELYKRNNSFKLILVCRKQEWEQFDNPYGNADWLEVYHVSGDKELAPLYATASAAVVVKTQCKYNDFAVSVKIFEYLSYGLPQVIIRSRAAERIINQDKIGLVVSQDKNEFANAIESLLDNSELYRNLQNNIETSLLTRNLWTHRVEQVEKDLMEYYRLDKQEKQ